jgi:PAS domain S-box-containing protein
MNDVDWSRVERTYRDRHEDIAESWYQALATTPTFVPLKATQIRQRLIELADQLFVLLLAESIAPDDAQVIGVALVDLNYTQPEALSRTLQVLAGQLVQGLDPAQVVALQPRLSGLLAEVAAGFLRRTRETILAEQGQIHAALLDQLRASEAELREARDSLEIQVAQRTAELATINRDLRDEVAERKRTEEALHRRTQELESLRHMGLELTTRLDLEEVLRSVVSRAMDLLDGISSGVSLYDAQEDVLRAAVNDGCAVMPLGTTFQRGESLSGTIWETGEALILDHYENPEDLVDSDAPPFVAVLGVPIVWGQAGAEEFLGTLVVETDPDRTFSPADVELLGQFAAQAAIAIRNAQLYERLEASERRYRGLFENVPVGLHRTTSDGWILAANAAIVRMLRYPSREALLAVNAAEMYVNPQDRARLLVPLEEQDVVSGIEVEVKRYDGSTGWVRTGLRAVRDADGQVIYYEGSSQDITEHKWALEALRESEESYRRLADNINDIVFTADLDGNLRYLNAAVRRFVGWSPEEMLGHHFVEYVHPDDMATLTSVMQRALAGEALETIPGFGPQAEYRMVRQDGEVIWVATRAMVVRDVQGKIVGFNGVVRDITERKQAEEALHKAYDELEQRVQERTAELIQANVALEGEIARRERVQQALQESEERYRSLFEKAPISVSVVDSEGNILAFNNTRLTGYTPDELLAIRDPSRIYYDPDERTEVWSIVREQGFVHQHEVRLTRRDGTPFDALVSIVPIVWEGRPCWQVMTVDVSELKQAQARLQQQADRLTILHKIDGAILSAQSVEETSESVLSRIQRLLPCQRASVVLFDEEVSEGRLIAAVGQGRDWVGEGGRFPLNAGLMPQLCQGNCSITLDSPVELQEFPIYQALLAEGLCACTCVPLVSQDELIGSLNLGTDEAGLLTAEHLAIVREIADSLVIAIQHARLVQFLADQRQHLRDLGARLADVEEAERKRLAQDLHNMVGQNLTALGINLSLIQSQMPEQAPSSVQTTLEDSLGLVTEATDRIRSVMAELRPPVLDDYGLVPALDWYAKRLASRVEVKITVSGEEPTPRLSARTETVLFRIAQEALTNVAKHAQATQVDVTVSASDSHVSLVIADDGVGFDSGQPRFCDEHGGWGLINMVERAGAIGGRCEIDSVPGEGTRVTVEVAR